MSIFRKVIKGEIDTLMIPLVLTLNKAGLETIACCEGHGKERAYVAIKLSKGTSVILEDDTFTIYWNKGGDDT